MPRHPPNAHNNEHTQTQQLNKHNHDTCGTRRPATTRTPPPDQERRKQERRGGTGEPAADREPQNINIETPSNPTTRVRRSFTYYRCSRPLCSSQPTRPHPPHNSLRKGCSAQGAPPQNPTACHAPTTTIAGRGRGAARPAGAGTPARPAPPRHPVFAAQQIRNPLERR